METNTYKKMMIFHGDHGRFVGLLIINYLLQVITLGLYYPWAKVKVLQYIYGETEYNGSRFVFHGTGKEIFMGFIKSIVLIGGIIAVFIFCMASKDAVLMVLGMIVYVGGLMAIIPLAIHGSYRYRMSRTSWRGIHFGYRGKIGELYRIFILNTILTVITFGIYGPWFQVALKRYVYGNLRFGNVEFKFTGNGPDLFILRLKGAILTIITLGIYSFWYMRDLMRFEIDNLKIIQDGKVINVKTRISGGKIAGLLITNLLIVMFTFGIGMGIAINRTLRVLMENMEFDAEIDPNSLQQTEEEYKDATGDDLASILDLSII